MQNYVLQHVLNIREKNYPQSMKVTFRKPILTLTEVLRHWNCPEDLCMYSERVSEQL
jgi:hypothetical protein